MQNESWMQPAFQAGEAVLLPALERPNTELSLLHHFQRPTTQSQAVFQPANRSWDEHPPAQTHTVEPRGSMAGRSVLRAAGVRTAPLTKRCRRCR